MDPTWGQNEIKIGPETVPEARSFPETFRDPFKFDLGSPFGLSLVASETMFGSFLVALGRFLVDAWLIFD